MIPQFQSMEKKINDFQAGMYDNTGIHYLATSTELFILERFQNHYPQVMVFFNYEKC